MVEGWGVRLSRFFSLKTTKSQIEGVFYLFSFGNVGWWKIQQELQYTYYKYMYVCNLQVPVDQPRSEQVTTNHSTAPDHFACMNGDQSWAWLIDLFEVFNS